MESANSLYQSRGMISPLMPTTGVTAREQMMYQEYLSNTAHQREMDDLKAAGLNPWLASNNGASVPAGSQDSAETIALLNALANVANATSGRGEIKSLEDFDSSIFDPKNFKKIMAPFGNPKIPKFGHGADFEDGVALVADAVSGKRLQLGKAFRGLMKIIHATTSVNKEWNEWRDKNGWSAYHTSAWNHANYDWHG